MPVDLFPVENPDQFDSPSLLVDAGRVRENIRRAVALGGDPRRLRPHVKTHKMRAVTDLLLAEGLRKFKCATPGEARMLAEAGAPDVLLAYPVVGPNRQRLHRLRAEFPQTRFAALVDHPDAARALSGAFADAPLDVFLDLNVGMNRTGLAATDAAAVFQVCEKLPGLRVVGLHGYDGHIRDTDLTERTRWADASFALVEKTRRQLGEKRNLTVVMGGTPTFSIHGRRPGVEASPGTFVFWDAGYGQHFPDLPFRIAAVLLTRVISVVNETTLCLDLGHKAVAAENPLPRVVFPNHPEAVPVAQSEEHLVVRLPDARAHRPGEVWLGVPVHICPTVNLYDRVHVLENGHYVTDWAVTARGH